MTTPIAGFNPTLLAQLDKLTQQAGAASKAGPTESQVQFKDLVMSSIDQVNNMQQSADMAVETLVTGGDINPAQVFTAIQKADMSFRMMQQIRNKLVDAYNEIKEIRV